MVFDMAGTTVCDDDNAVAGRLCDALRAAGADVTEPDVNPLMGTPKPAAVRTLLTQARGEAPSEDEVERVHADYQRRIIEHYRSAPTVREMPGVREMFAGLRERGIRIGLDTGFDRATTDTILERLGWNMGLVDDTVSSDEVPNGRPHPDMIHALMERAGVTDPKAVGKAGDSISDIEQGRNAGCGLVVAVLSERTRTVTEDYPGVHAIKDLAELLPIVDALGDQG